MTPVTEEMRPPWKGPTLRHLSPAYRLGFTCAGVAKVDANTPEKAKAHRVAHDILVMLYPHENIVDSRLYTSVTPCRRHGCMESLRAIGSSSLTGSQLLFNWGLRFSNPSPAHSSSIDTLRLWILIGILSQ